VERSIDYLEPNDGKMRVAKEVDEELVTVLSMIEQWNSVSMKGLYEEYINDLADFADGQRRRKRRSFAAGE
jgi:hypothetical protein